MAAPCGQQRHRPQSGQRYQRLRAAYCNRLTLGSLRAVRESPGQSNEFLARKAQAVEDRYGIVLFHRAEQGPAGVGAQRLRVPLLRFKRLVRFIIYPGTGRPRQNVVKLVEQQRFP